MKCARWLAVPCLLGVAACASNVSKGTIAQLRDVKIDLTDVRIDAGANKAMASYEKFLKQTPETAMTPEAMRRLADLKVQQDYGTREGLSRNVRQPAQSAGPPARAKLAPPTPAARVTGEASAPLMPGRRAKGHGASRESNEAFEARATRAEVLPSSAPSAAAPKGGNAESHGNAADAIKLYRKLLEKYPNYARNDQVLYQLSRAYDELGMSDEAMRVMTQIAREFPGSRYYDEVQFRIGEYYFTRRKFLDSEDAYKSIVSRGPGSEYYELALYKLGWSLYKQELYEESLHRFTALLDEKVKNGYDFEHPKNPLEQQRIIDTFHVISLAFSYLGGPEAMKAYFAKNGKRDYEVDLYGNLGEYYLQKRRYSDAAAAYEAFVKQHPYHKAAPHFDMRVIEIYKKGGFPRLVIAANKDFVVKYGLKSDYWKHFDAKDHPDVIGYVKTSLKELASHYHSLYQDKKFAKDKPENFQESMRWYREYLTSFPKEVESPGIHYQMADLLLENKNYAQAAVEFEHTAYDYPPHDKAADAGYAAVYALREQLSRVTDTADKDRVAREVIRSSLRFSETFQHHEKAALVMSAAIDDIYALKDYPLGVSSSRKFIALFPNAEQRYRRRAWLVLAHSSFELGNYADAEEGFRQVLPLTPEHDKSHQALVEGLAASIYKQGEQASKRGDYKAAAENFLRVATAAPTSKIKPAADYDGASALIQLKDWDRAAAVLRAFRTNYPGHKLQPDVTKKLAQVYRESGQLGLAAAEYERIETESQDAEVRSAALQLAADLYAEAKETDKALAAYRRYVSYFPRPLDRAMENRFKIATILKSRNDTEAYFAELREMVSADAAGGSERTSRTRYLAATSLLTLTEPAFDEFVKIKLVEPFAENVARKKAQFKKVKEAFENILQYKIGETTAAATYYLAETYYNFSRSLMESERPDDLTAAQKEQYELSLEEQADPFEQLAIKIHEKNTDLVTVGVFNPWVEKSFEKLAKLFPARYAKVEQSSGYIETLDRVAAFDVLTRPPQPKAKLATGAAAAPGTRAVKSGEAPAQTEAGVPAAPAKTDTAPKPAEGAPAQAQEQGAPTENKAGAAPAPEAPTAKTGDASAQKKESAPAAPATTDTASKPAESAPAQAQEQGAPTENKAGAAPAPEVPTAKTGDAPEQKELSSPATPAKTDAAPKPAESAPAQAQEQGAPAEKQTGAAASVPADETSGAVPVQDETDSPPQQTPNAVPLPAENTAAPGT